MHKEFKIEQYQKKLDQKDQEILTEDVEESVKRLAEPLVLVDYNNAGSVEIKKEGIEINFSFYDILDKELKDGIISDLARDYKDHKDVESKSFLDKKKWKELKTFEFKLDDGENINLFDKIPQECKIFFFPNNMFVNAGYCEFPDGVKTICFIGDMSSLAAIPILLHEAGHGWDYEHMEKLGVKSLVEHGSNDIGINLEKIRKERSASAFALKVLRSSFKTESQLKQDIVNFLKSYALKGYCDSI